MKNYEKIPFNQISDITSYVEEKLRAGRIIIQIIANESLKQIDELISYANDKECKSYYRNLADSDEQLRESVITEYIDPYYAFKDEEDKECNDIDINEDSQNVIDFIQFKADFKDMQQYYDEKDIPYYGKAHYEFYISTGKGDIEDFGGCMEVEFITEWMIEHGYYNPCTEEPTV